MRCSVDDPASVSFPLFEGRTCVLINAPDGNCTVGGYPTYAVNVSTVAQIQMTVNFARNANLRLVIKNKGHDYNAKSTGGGGLSVFTGYLRDIRYIPEYSYPRGGYTGPAFKIGPGVEIGTIYEYADNLNLSVVGGIGRVRPDLLSQCRMPNKIDTRLLALPAVTPRVADTPPLLVCTVLGQIRSYPSKLCCRMGLL